MSAEYGRGQRLLELGSIALFVLLSFHAVFIHANVRWRFPYLRWVITTPEYHH